MAPSTPSGFHSVPVEEPFIACKRALLTWNFTALNPLRVASRVGLAESKAYNFTLGSALFAHESTVVPEVKVKVVSSAASSQRVSPLILAGLGISPPLETIEPPKSSGHPLTHADTENPDPPSKTFSASPVGISTCPLARSIALPEPKGVSLM